MTPSSMQVIPATPPALPAVATVPQVPPVPPLMSVSPEQKLELLEYWRSVVKRRWLILGLAAVAALLAAVVALSITPVYRATATVLIEAGKGKILSIEDIYSSNQQREHYQTQVEVLKSREVVLRAVRTLKLWEHPLFDPRRQDPSLRATVAQALGIGSAKLEWTEAELADAVVEPVMESLSIEPVRLSQLVRVSFSNENAALAARIANTVAQEYIRADRDARFRISQEVSSFLQERLSSLRDTLAESEQALQTYRERKGIVNLAGSPQTVAGQQVGGAADNLLRAQAKRLELEGSYQQAKSIRNGDYAQVPIVTRDWSVIEALRGFNEGERRLAEARQTLGASHPRIQQLESELASLRANVQRQREAAVASLTREYEAARDTEKALQRSLDTARDEVQSVNREEFQLAVLEREVQTNRQLYDMFMSRAKETDLAGDVQASIARVVDAAVPPTLPFKPAKSQIVAVATLLAVLVGALASILMDRLDNTFKGAEDIESRLKQPVLTALPEMPALARDAMSRLFLDDAHSHYAEAIRTARTGVLLSKLDVAHKVLLVTSTLPGEGKTTVAINLALAHAQTKRTLLIDCDMRRPQVARSLGLAAGGKGLTNLVAGTDAAQQCMTPVPGSDLLVMAVGDLPPNPLELLLSQRFQDALAELSRQFDVVILDSPPVELVSEALVLAPLSTSTVFVIKAMSTPAPLVRKSLARLQRAGGSLLGVIVNQLDFERARAYYGEYTASSYSYGGYGYGGQLGYGPAQPDPSTAGGKPA